MKKHKTLVAFTLGFDTVVLIPESWTVFQYRGFVYRRDAVGRFVIEGKTEAKVGAA